MPWGNMGGWTAVVILVVVLLLFGASKLPALAKSAGESLKIFKKEMKTDSGATAPSTESEPAATVSAEAQDESKPADPPPAS